MGKKEERNFYQKELKKESKRRSVLLILLVVLLVSLGVMAAGTGIWLIRTKAKDGIYSEYISEANKYLTDMNYSEAEISYLKAIEEDPSRTEAYSKLSAMYIAQERWDDAQTLLVRGIQATNSTVLVKSYQRVMLELDYNDAQMVETSTNGYRMDELSQDITIDTSLFDVAAEYTYTDYIQHYGQPVLVVDNAKGGCDFRFDGYAGILSFYNVADDNFIFDTATKQPYATRKPNEIYFGLISDIFGNYQGAISFEKLQELFGEGIRVETDSAGERYQVVISYHRCTLYVDCDESGNIFGTPENKLLPASDRGESQDQEEGNRVAGYVINALNGGGVSSTLRFLKGGRYGTAEKEVSAKYDGSFDVKLPAGTYTVEIRATGFITGYEEIVVQDHMELTGLNFTLSPSLQSGEIRIVLTWGATPRDLDSHLEGSSSAGNPIHISYRYMETDGVAKLDLDDVSGYGPETTTIYDTGGSYTFTVHDFTNGGNSASTQLASSGATVKIYLAGSDQPIVYTVPSGSGTYWTVCRIENGQVTPVNIIR